ncbi:DJ-1/PfpI family protein [Ammoniphilus resinae]|uniref:Transcriptional regulator GlxA family with amidase domain n=1 Tax=Ammoniphilus resinae TaxID=861532 RepID=A0ABS4GRT7_9BACL|nr:DJ-1/PfpI family protein [Ammoniphilus resinae]MBP1932993.1 transcriptional regulator GlxA family with amidase domain [Ammoniphilus resinae]
MLKLFMRFLVYVVTFTVLVGGVGFLGFLGSQKDFWVSFREEALPSLQGLEKPKHDPSKPTVAVLLGSAITEGSDFTIPYEIFSRTGAYNVYAVAPDTNVKSLSGGLDVVPHYSFQEMDQLLGKSPDIIAIPFMSEYQDKTFEPVKNWILKHQNTDLVSICAGADVLASTGLLDGKTMASHWQTIDFLSKKYPEVDWIRDQRYVQPAQNIVSSAGISSGIDAVLYVISQKLGEPAAAKIAKEMNYPSYHFVENPEMDPFLVDWRYSTYVLNNAYQWNKEKAGVLLYDGVEEMALASVFDIYGDTGTTKIFSISQSGDPIVTKHGLNLVPRYSSAKTPQLDKLIVPGREARSLAADDLKTWNAKTNTNDIQFVHSDSPERFYFEVQLEDLAKQEDLQTAKHAVKRLEYRVNDIDLQGKPFSFDTYGNLLATALLSLVIAFYIDRKFIMKRKCCSLSLRR